MNEQTHRWHTNIPGLVEGNTRPVLELLSGYETQVGANRPLFWFCPSCRKTSRTNWSKVYFLFLKTMFFSPPFITIGLDWTSKANKKPGFADIFCRCFFVEALGGTADCPFPLSVLLQEYWLFTAHGSPLPNHDTRRKMKYSLQQFLFV